MAGLNIRFSLVVSAVLIQLPLVVHTHASNFDEAWQAVFETCPIPWEGLYAQIDVVPGADIWQSNLGDKARYINFSSPGMTALDSDGGGLLKIKRYSDLESIPACSLMRQYFYGAARLDAQAAAGFDHTAIRDDDIDGVFNLEDICSDTLAGESVDADGCSATQLASDEDGDGIHDSIDQCPNTPSGETPDPNGCVMSQVDADGDGIPNADDPYPWQSSVQCLAN